MVITIAGWIFGLIALYLLLTNYVGGSSLATGFASAGVSGIKALQGR